MSNNTPASDAVMRKALWAMEYAESYIPHDRQPGRRFREALVSFRNTLAQQPARCDERCEQCGYGLLPKTRICTKCGLVHDQTTTSPPTAGGGEGPYTYSLGALGWIANGPSVSVLCESEEECRSRVDEWQAAYAAGRALVEGNLSDAIVVLHTIANTPIVGHNAQMVTEAMQTLARRTIASLAEPKCKRCGDTSRIPNGNGNGDDHDQYPDCMKGPQPCSRESGSGSGGESSVGTMDTSLTATEAAAFAADAASDRPTDTDRDAVLRECVTALQLMIECHEKHPRWCGFRADSPGDTIHRLAFDAAGRALAKAAPFVKEPLP